MLDKHRLLQQVSSDIIHLLSLTTLFEGLSSSCMFHVHHADLIQPMTLFRVTRLWPTEPRSTSHNAAYGYGSFPLLGLLPLLIEYSLKVVSCQLVNRCKLANQNHKSFEAVYTCHRQKIINKARKIKMQGR